MARKAMFPALFFSFSSFLLFLFCASPLAAQETSMPSASDVALVLMREGMELRHSGKMESALKLYHQALEIDPENANVLYELCISYFQLGDYDNSIEYGERGAELDSELRSQFYSAIGSCYDNMGQPEKAVAMYKKGIATDPAAPMLRYNLALTLANKGDLAGAEKAIKDELLVNPEHASSHMLLSILYAERNERVPALLGTVRFLMLEPEGPRSEEALRRLKDLLTTGVKQPKKDANGRGDINILLDMGESTEGDFKGIDMMLGILTAGTLIDSVPTSEFRNMQKMLRMTLGLIGEKKKGESGKGFAAEYYVPYFAAVHDSGKTDILVRTVLMSHDDPEAQAWLNEVENMKAVQDFIEWSRKFAWKRM